MASIGAFQSAPSDAAYAAAGVRTMLRGRFSVVPGWTNPLMVFAVRFTPRWLQPRASQLLMGN